MSNIIDYMKWRGDVPLSACGFNEVDNIILSSATFVDLDGIVCSELGDEGVSFEGVMRAFESVAEERGYLGVLQPSRLLDVSREAAACPRYRGARLVGFVNEIDEARHMQFSAVTFLLDDDSIYVAFRGTDDTIVGWKEDLMMGFHAPVPAQSRAVEYLEQVAAAYSGVIRLGGHSKGGNIAMWAAAFSNEQTRSRINVAYNNDGPGFLPEVISSPQFEAMADRIITFVPQSSVVGMLLDQSPRCQIIKSTQPGILQHDPMSWEVLGTRFVYAEKRPRSAVQADEKTKRWLYSMTPEQRRVHMELLFSVIDSTGAKTLTDLARAKLKSINTVMKTLRSMDKESRTMMSHAMVTLLGGRARSSGDAKQTPTEEGAALPDNYSENDGESDKVD